MNVREERRFKMKILKKKLTALAMVVAMLVCLCPQTLYASGGSMKGDGTAENPYVIMDETDLRAVAADLSACYVM